MNRYGRRRASSLALHHETPLIACMSALGHWRPVRTGSRPGYVRYRALSLIERFFNKIEQCRRVATRYDKLAANYLSFIKLASIRIWLRAYESTP
jgi:transposase